MDLAQAIIDSVNGMEQSGKLQAIIDTAAEKCVKSAVEDLFSYRGDLAEGIKARVKAAAVIDFNAISLPNFQVLMAQQLTSTYVAAMEKLGIDQTERVVNELLGVREGPLKLSQLVDAMKEEIDKDDSGWDDEVTLLVEHSGSSAWVYMDPKDGTEQYKCQLRMLVNTSKDRKIFCVTIDEKQYGGGYSHVPSPRRLELGREDKLHALLIHAYTTGREVLLDEDACNLRVREEED